MITPTRDLNHLVLPGNRLASWNLSEQADTMYYRTQNDNGSYNTRCLDCFMTIASSVETEEELAAREQHHICPEKALADLLAQERFLVSRAQLN
ncbi:MAG: hypothetical protein ABR987_12165 [Terracidiphilus sp.]|jgi:hypothetical protein